MRRDATSAGNVSRDKARKAALIGLLALFALGGCGMLENRQGPSSEEIRGIVREEMQSMLDAQRGETQSRQTGNQAGGEQGQNQEDGQAQGGMGQGQGAQGQSGQSQQDPDIQRLQEALRSPAGQNVIVESVREALQSSDLQMQLQQQVIIALQQIVSQAGSQGGGQGQSGGGQGGDQGGGGGGNESGGGGTR